MRFKSIAANSTIHFRNLKRQEHYLQIIHNMDSESQTAFRQIYDASQAPHQGGKHVIFASIAALKYPGIFQLAKENVLFRMLLRKARRFNNKEAEQRLEEILEDFHVATIAFVTGRPLAEVAAERKQHADDSKCGQITERSDGLFHYILENQSSINRFKEAFERSRNKVKSKS